MTNIILIVDDDPLMRWSLATNLEDEGFEPRAFGSGPEALEYLAEGGDAAAMLLDWQMPEMDGINVLRHLRRRGHTLPVIFLSGHSLPGRREVAMACGAAAFLDKTKSFSTVLHYLHLAVGEPDDLGGPVRPPLHAAAQPLAGK
ncbi:MAG: response regulator [Alphaproteobacteria bacterium]|nr:response regulator [Alphaproteobacteria bacterium]